MIIKTTSLITETPGEDQEEDIEEKRIVEGHQMMKKREEVMMRWKEVAIEAVYYIMMRLLIDLKDR